MRKAKLESLKSDKLLAHPVNERQWEFANCDALEVMLSGLNQQGKTTILMMIAAWELTGRYPVEFTGPRLYAPFEALMGGRTAETTRDLLTDYLLKDEETGKWGGGFLPKESFDPERDIVFSRGGVGGQIDYVMINFWHPDTGKFMGKSKLYSRAMSRRAEQFQGYRNLKRIYIDEEPDYDVYEELSARAGTKKDTRMRIAETPTLGATELWLKFFESVDEKRWHFVRYDIDDCSHLSEEDVEDQIAKWEHSPLKQARLHGLAPMGEGMLFPFLDADIVISSDFEAPYTWNHLIGIDYPHGYGNFAAAKIAWDKEEDVIYVLKVVKLRGQTSPVYIDRLVKMGGKKIPIAWPHDMNRRMESGQVVANRYREAGLNMLSLSAQFDDGSNAPMTAVEDVCDRMASGRIKFKEDCVEFFEEKRKFKQKNGKIDKTTPGWDDVIDAVLKTIMMLRFSQPAGGRAWLTAAAPGKLLQRGNFYRTRPRGKRRF